MPNLPLPTPSEDGTPEGLSDRRVISFHGAFLITAMIFVLVPLSMPVGWRVFAAGVAYNLALPTFAARHVEPRWIHIWTFLVPLSWLLIFPDWFLASQLQTLVFPDLGIVKIGPVSAFMGLLWVIPLFLIVYCAERVVESRSLWQATIAAATVSLISFALAGAALPHLDLWRAIGVATFSRLAIYVLGPKAILGANAFIAYRLTSNRGVIWRLVAATFVMVIYLGSLIVSWWLLES